MTFLCFCFFSALWCESTLSRWNSDLCVWRRRTRLTCRKLYLFKLNVLVIFHLYIYVYFEGGEGSTFILNGSSNSVPEKGLCFNWLLARLTFSASTTDRHCECTDDVVTEFWQAASSGSDIVFCPHPVSNVFMTLKGIPCFVLAWHSVKYSLHVCLVSLNWCESEATSVKPDRRLGFIG